MEPVLVPESYTKGLAIEKGRNPWQVSFRVRDHLLLMLRVKKQFPPFRGYENNSYICCRELTGSYAS